MKFDDNNKNPHSVAMFANPPVNKNLTAVQKILRLERCAFLEVCSSTKYFGSGRYSAAARSISNRKMFSIALYYSLYILLLMRSHYDKAHTQKKRFVPVLSIRAKRTTSSQMVSVDAAPVDPYGALLVVSGLPFGCCSN